MVIDNNDVRLLGTIAHPGDEARIEVGAFLT
jgi:hypothetical protein